MKRLLLLRHAKSSWDDTNLADFDRPLNDRGIAAAQFMGELMGGNKQVPDEIVSSPAKRAIQTATLVKESAGFDAAIRLEERIYEANPQTLYQIAREFRDELETVMMIGHNPGFEGFLALLTDTVVQMPTAGLAIVDLPIKSWSDLQAGSGKLVEIIRPKDAMQKLS